MLFLVHVFTLVFSATCFASFSWLIASTLPVFFPLLYFSQGDILLHCDARLRVNELPKDGHAIYLRFDYKTLTSFQLSTMGLYFPTNTYVSYCLGRIGGRRRDP